MKRTGSWQIELAICFALGLAECCSVRADGRAGAVKWSDGKEMAGALSLSPGRQLRLFTNNTQISLSLDEVKEIRFKPEKEEMREGFYFPNAGQATQAKTGEVYPTRSLQTEITLADGTVVTGHLFTTTLYLETDDATQKIVLMAKQTGTDGQKLADLVYPTDIHFEANAPSEGSVQIDLSGANLSDLHPPVIIGRPDLALLPSRQVAGKSIWTVPAGDPAEILFEVEAADGWHVAWPATSQSGPAPDADVQASVETGLKEMQDFYDTRTLLGCFSDSDDVYSLVMMSRLGTTYSFEADKKPWSLVVLRWKYDAAQKKVTLLNRIALGTGRAQGNSAPPPVFMNADLLHDISKSPAAPAKGASP